MSVNPDEQHLLERESIGQTNGQEKPQPPKKKREKPKDVVTFRTHLTTLAHVSVVLFVYLIYKLATRSEFEFFTWHPILMSIGWMLLMTEGFFAINKYNTHWRLKTTGGFRVKVHVTFLAIGFALSILGFAVAYINKSNHGKSHFVSWHGLAGLIALIGTCSPVINGLGLWYKKELKVQSPRWLKFVHVTSGTVVFTFGAVALILSLFTNWFGKKSLNSRSVFYFGLITVGYPLVWAVIGPSVKLYRVVKDYFSDDKVE